MDSIVNDLASSPVTVTEYELSGNALPNVMVDVLGVPVNETADPDLALRLVFPNNEPVIPPVTVKDPDIIELFWAINPSLAINSLAIT